MLSDCEAVVPPDDARLVNCGAAGFSAEFIILGLLCELGQRSD